MAFNGSLLMFGADEFPHTYIKAESYKCVPQRRIDLDSGVSNANGILERNVLAHRRTTISFDTKDGMFNNELAAMWSFIKSHYINEAEKKVRCTYYDPIADGYATGDFYIPDIEFPIYYLNSTKKIIQYRSQTIELIEY